MPYNYCRLSALLFVAAVLAACGGRQEAEGLTGSAPLAVEDAAPHPALSNDSQAGDMLNAPGNYVRGMAGDIDRAKAAAALAGKTAADRMNVDPSNDAGN